MRKFTVEGLEAPRLTVFISVPLAVARCTAAAAAAVAVAPLRSAPACNAK
jgi:hypothetical protein